MDAFNKGVISAVTFLARGTTCFGVEVLHHAEYQADQPEQRAEHDDSAHVRTPFDTRSTFRIVRTILNPTAAESGLRSEQQCPSERPPTRRARPQCRPRPRGGPVVRRADFCSTPREPCSPTRTTAAP